MEQSVTSLAFRGTIAEAIAEAKREKKVFVVYTSGDNPGSKLLETSTWIDSTVSATLAKCCIFLHILEGSSESSYFSALYPQNYSPCITAIGYNGVRLWQNEGFVTADVLASSLEKAWLSLHLQETTAAFLSAALASGASQGPSTEQGSQETYGPLPSTIDHNLSPDAQHPVNYEASVERKSHEDSCKEETDSKLDAGIFLTSHVDDSSQICERSSIIETENISLNPEQKGQNELDVALPVPENGVVLCGNGPGSGNEVSQNIVEEVSAVKSQEVTEIKKVDSLDSPAIKSNLVFLKIRLPDGSSLEASFSGMDTLRIVQDYINGNQTISFGSFNLEIPYPRHVFSDQDLDRTLSALGLFNRCTLMVVPQVQTNSNHRGRSSMHPSEDLGSSSERNEGYWASVKRILSYVNPLSYLSGGVESSSTAKESRDGIWQYSPNSSLQNNMRGSGSSAGVHSPDQSTPAGGRNSNSNGRQQTSGFGGNIHTLKHDEDDNNDRNVFWNGNSTQFGGNGDGR